MRLALRWTLVLVAVCYAITYGIVFGKSDTP